MFYEFIEKLRETEVYKHYRSSPGELAKIVAVCKFKGVDINYFDEKGVKCYIGDPDKGLVLKVSKTEFHMM